MSSVKCILIVFLSLLAVNEVTAQIVKDPTTWTIEAKTVLISTVFRIRFVCGAGVTIN